MMVPVKIYLMTKAPRMMYVRSRIISILIVLPFE